MWNAGHDVLPRITPCLPNREIAGLLAIQTFVFLHTDHPGSRSMVAPDRRKKGILSMGASMSTDCPPACVSPDQASFQLCPAADRRCETLRGGKDRRDQQIRPQHELVVDLPGCGVFGKLQQEWAHRRQADLRGDAHLLGQVGPQAFAQIARQATTGPPPPGRITPDLVVRTAGEKLPAQSRVTPPLSCRKAMQRKTGQNTPILEPAESAVHEARIADIRRP